MQPLVFIGFALLVIAFIIFASLAAAKRRKELAAWAMARGLSFSPEKQRNYDDLYPAFTCFRQGSNRYADNIIYGQLSAYGFLGFDYHYTTTSSNGKTTQSQQHCFSAIILGSPIPLKPLYIRPEGFFDKITEFFGADDIDFESAEFSRKFFVKADDRKWAYDIIHQRAMEFLLAERRFTMQMDRGFLLIQDGRQFGAADFDSATRVSTGLLDMMPPYLVKQQKELA